MPGQFHTLVMVCLSPTRKKSGSILAGAITHESILNKEVQLPQKCCTSSSKLEVDQSDQSMQINVEVIMTSKVQAQVHKTYPQSLHNESCSGRKTIKSNQIKSNQCKINVIVESFQIFFSLQLKIQRGRKETDTSLTI